MTEVSALHLLTGIFLAIGGIYSGIMALIVTGLLRIKKPSQEKTPVSTKVSLIIPARNEEMTIKNCLHDILVQDFPADLLEVIVVDDHSTDHTPEVVRNFASEHPAFSLHLLQLYLLPGAGISKKAGIETAVNQAAGDLIITTDADTRRDKGWIRSMVACYEKDRPLIILGPVAFKGEDTFFTRLQALEFTGLMGVTAGACMSGFPVMCNGANLAYEKKIFTKVGGYTDNNKIVSGDDIFLMIRIRKSEGNRTIQFLFSKDSIVYTDPCRTFPDFVSQRIRWVSKNKSYRDPLISFVAAITWLFSFILVAGLIAGIFSRLLLVASLILIVVKLLAEFIPVTIMAGFFNKRKLLVIFPVAGILNIFYTFIIGIAGIFFPFVWKGRRIT